MATRWHYIGDLNLEYGGTFFDMSEWRNGYVTAVEVTDLDSACGFDGALLIEERTIIVDDRVKWASALSAIGASLLDNGDIDDNGHTLRKDTLGWRMRLTYALSSHGFYDTERSVVVQPRKDCATDHDGWHADRIRYNGLRPYVRKEFLGLSR